MRPSPRLCKCVVVPSACILMFCLVQDVSGWEAGEFPQVNDSKQKRLRAQQSTAAGCHSGQRKSQIRT